LYSIVEKHVNDERFYVEVGSSGMGWDGGEGDIWHLHRPLNKISVIRFTNVDTHYKKKSVQTIDLKKGKKTGKMPIKRSNGKRRGGNG